MSITQRQHFNKLYQGTSEVIHELCTEGSYQEGTYVFYYGTGFSLPRLSFPFPSSLDALLHFFLCHFP